MTRRTYLKRLRRRADGIIILQDVTHDVECECARCEADRFERWVQTMERWDVEREGDTPRWMH